MQHMLKLLRETARPTNCPSSANSRSHWSSPNFFVWHRVTYWQLSVTPSELGHRGASSFRWYNCWEKSSWPDTCKEVRNREERPTTQNRTFASYRQCMYIHLPRAKQKTLKERHQLSNSQYGADIRNLQLCGMDTISQKSPDKILCRHLLLNWWFSLKANNVFDHRYTVTGNHKETLLQVYDLKRVWNKHPRKISVSLSGVILPYSSSHPDTKIP